MSNGETIQGDSVIYARDLIPFAGNVWANKHGYSTFLI
jgi:hypothetical protein